MQKSFVLISVIRPSPYIRRYPTDNGLSSNGKAATAPWSPTDYRLEPLRALRHAQL